jgi:hypothetical protein
MQAGGSVPSANKSGAMYSNLEFYRCLFEGFPYLMGRLSPSLSAFTVCEGMWQFLDLGYGKYVVS